MITDRALLERARATLTDQLFRVWFAKHYQALGRRSGSVALGITEEAWRYRLALSIRILDNIHVDKETAA